MDFGDWGGKRTAAEWQYLGQTHAAAIHAAASRYGADTSANSHLAGAEIGAEASKYHTDVGANTTMFGANQTLEGTKMRVAAGLPETGTYAKGGPVPTAGKPILVGEKGPELFVPQSPGVVVPNHRLTPSLAAAAVPAMADGGTVNPEDLIFSGPNSAYLRAISGSKERLARIAQENRERIARIQSEPHMRQVNQAVLDAQRKTNLDRFSRIIDATYPGKVDDKGVMRPNPIAERFKATYQSQAEVDPQGAVQNAKEAIGAMNTLTKFQNPEVLNPLLKSGKIPPDIYNRAIGGELPVLLTIAKAAGEPGAARWQPGLFTGDYTAPGMPGMTPPGHPNSTPGIHVNQATGDRYQVDVNPDGTSRSYVIGPPPSPEEIQKFQEEYAKTPAGQLPEHQFFGADGKTVYDWSKRDASGKPTIVNAATPGATGAGPPKPQGLADIDVYGAMGMKPEPYVAPKPITPEEMAAGALAGFGEGPTIPSGPPPEAPSIASARVPQPLEGPMTALYAPGPKGGPIDTGGTLPPPPPEAAPPMSITRAATPPEEELKPGM
jgi:hypothetical protein